MEAFYFSMALFLLFNVLLGLMCVLQGPTPADRMLAAQLFGTTGVAMLLLLAQGMGIAALRDVALVFALLGGLTVVAFVRRAWIVSNRNEER